MTQKLVDLNSTLIALLHVGVPLAFRCTCEPQWFLVNLSVLFVMATQ